MEYKIKNKIYKYNYVDNTYSFYDNELDHDTNTISKICIILDSAIHNPPLAGLPKRVFELSEGLNSKGVEVVWIIANRNFKTINEIDSLNVYFAKIYLLNLADFYNPDKVCNILEKENVQLVQFEVVQTFLRLGTQIKHKLGVPLVLEVHDVDSVLSEKIDSSVTASDSFYLQKIALDLADSVIVISPIDYEFIKNNMDIIESKYFLAENFIKTNEEFSKVEKKYDVVYLGNMHYKPNKDGLIYFCNSILPTVKEELKRDMNVLVIGMVDNELINSLSGKINFCGPVNSDEELRAKLACARVAICPLNFGSGMKVKILDYSASSLPIVTTSIGSYGYEKIKSLIITDEANEFANKISNLLTNEDTAIQIGKNNFEHVKDCYSFESVSKNILKSYKYAIKKTTTKKVPEPFWLSENRHSEDVLDDSFVISREGINKINP